MAAARVLRGAGKSVLVVEARDEVGGRARSREIDGSVADFGGEWIGRAHRRMHRLVRELGLDVEPARNVGRPINWRLPGGQTCRRLPPPHTWPSLSRAIGSAAWLSHGIDADAPWSSGRAANLDSQSVAAWLDERDLDPASRYIFERLFGSLTRQDLNSVSLLQLLWLLRIAGGPLRSMNAAFQWRISQGAQQVARRMAAPLGGAVRLNTAIIRITQRHNSAALQAATLTVRANRVIVAIPVTQLPRVEFDPPLPLELGRLCDLHIDAGTKVIALLPQGHSGRHNTVVGGDVLWGAWRRGDRITGFLPATETAVPDGVLVADLARAFGVQPEDLRCPTVLRWADQQHIEGCDAVFAPGEVCTLGPLMTKPHGLIEFAGAERSGWPVNMEGAIRSGERAARQTLMALKECA